MQIPYEITVPGFSVSAALPSVRWRLVADFPERSTYWGTTAPATLLTVYSGENEIDAWWSP
jgi:hypothetical protein